MPLEPSVISPLRNGLQFSTERGPRQGRLKSGTSSSSRTEILSLTAFQENGSGRCSRASKKRVNRQATETTSACFPQGIRPSGHSTERPVENLCKEVARSLEKSIKPDSSASLIRRLFLVTFASRRPWLVMQATASGPQHCGHPTRLKPPTNSKTPDRH